MILSRRSDDALKPDKTGGVTPLSYPDGMILIGWTMGIHTILKTLKVVAEPFGVKLKRSTGCFTSRAPVFY